MDSISISVEQAVNMMQLRLPTAIDTMEIDELMQTALQTLDGKVQEKWVLDLREVDYMGSAMLGMMVNIRQKIRQGGGKLVLFGMSATLLQTFKTCCLERLFTIARTRDEALAAAARG